MSLVADYSDSSSSSSSSSTASDTESEKFVEQSTKSAVKKPLLPSASSLFTEDAKSAGEVFQTRYHKEEQAKKALLERHVKMVENDEHLTTKNGRKICWNYRFKGRCRFGTQCQFAHDSDLATESAAQSPQSNIPQQKSTSTISKTAQQIPSTIDEKDTNESTKRKRPGLGDSIIPGKRVMKAYKKHTT